jgi:hypothetical protein
MLRRIAAGALLCGLTALSAGCAGTTTPTTPTTTTKTTDTFTGNLAPANANTHSFVTIIGGEINATLTAVGPDNTQSMGFSLGTFSALTNVCTVVLDNPAASQGFTFNATAATTGTFCVRVYDNGNVKTASDAGKIGDDNPWTYTVTVTHP